MKIIFDKDGTLFNNTQRMHLLPSKEEANRTEGWTAFNQACINDEPITTTHLLYHALAPIYATYIVTGAGEDSRCQTEQLLKLYDMGAHDELYMRPVDDHRPAPMFKLDLFQSIGLRAGDIVIDDDPKILQMVRENFPGVILIEVPSMCSAVQNGISAEGSNIVGAKVDAIFYDDLDGSED